MNEIKYENRKNCPIRSGCNFLECKKNIKTRIKVNDHETNLGEFEIKFCTNCRLGFTDPVPTEKTSKYLYQFKNTSDFDVINGTVIDRIKDYLSVKLLKRISPNSKVKSVLDYSTGNGRFALSATKAFPFAHVDAVDYQLSAPPIIEANNTINYISINDFNNISRKYDLIILRHVLEHSYDPIKLLKELSNKLTANGILYIEVPNFDSGSARILGKYWKLYYVPRHVFYYTKKSLEEVINKSGMTAQIKGIEIPIMGNTIAIFTGFKQDNLFVQLLGAALQPLQSLTELFFCSSTCLSAKCKKKS